MSEQGDRDYHSEEENVAEERPRSGRTEEQELRSRRRKPALVRSKTLDRSLLTRVQTDSDRKKCPHSQLSKSNCQFHKIFQEISREEQLRQSYTCALQKDILYQGRMFVSQHWICFHSKVFGRDTKVAIPVVSVTHIKKTRTAMLVPNALVIATSNDRYVFVSLLSRDNTYKFLTSLCLHLEEKSPCSSPVPSSAESSFRGQRSPLTPRFPLSLTSDLCDLDPAVRGRSPDLEESSSSDCQTPDDEKLTEFPVPSFLDVSKNSSPPLDQQSSDVRTLKPGSLNTLFVYLFLVCVLLLSSCYLAFKVVWLEQTLTTLGSVAHFNHDDEGVATADVFSELLSVNLLKLQKVQQDLQRLLDEAA